MPRYYFDVHDRQGVHPDEVGLDFPDMDSAIIEARRALVDMTRENLADDATAISIVIRDGDEGPVNLIVSMTTEWLDGKVH
jgi:hypothetical protein